MNLRIADLHTHSTRSDGTHAPAEVVRMASAAGLSILALTDHDTIRGNPEAAAASKEIGIEFVPGVEISALHEGEEYHILGYFVESCRDLDAYVDMMESRRDERLVEVVRRLDLSGLRLDVDAIREAAAGVATRSHIARHMVDVGLVDSIAAAFQQYLGAGRIGYIPVATVSVADAIRLVHAAGGCASLAHPGEWLADREVSAFRRAGLDAIETVHPSHDGRLTKHYSALAKRLGLLETGGSDFHTATESETGLPGSFRVSGERVEALRKRASLRTPDSTSAG